MPTLFYDSTMVASDFRKRYQIAMSNEFAACADHQLTTIFEQQTGLKISKQVSVTTVSEHNFSMESGATSRFPLLIYINHNWNLVTVTWKSRSGKIYTVEDTAINCEDITFGFEGLNPALYHQQLYPNYKFPFKLKNLTYQLDVVRMNMDSTLKLYLKSGIDIKENQILALIDEFINKYNQKSEKKNRKYGLVHNWKSTANELLIQFDLDLGSAGPSLYKELLPYLSELAFFEKVLIE